MASDDVLASGYAAGMVYGGSSWVTVPGSTHKSVRDIVRDTRAAAEDDAARLKAAFPDVTVRRVDAVEHSEVTVSGVAYRATDPGYGDPVTYTGSHGGWHGKQGYVSDGPRFSDGRTTVDLYMTIGDQVRGERVVAELFDVDTDHISRRSGQKRWFTP